MNMPKRNHFLNKIIIKHKKVGKHEKHINPPDLAMKTNYLDVFGSLKPS